MSGAAFTGFELSLLVAGLLAIGITAPLMIGLVGIGVMAGLVFMQWQRWIERFDLIILGGISWGIALVFVSALRSMPYLAIPLMVALLFVAATALFRLIYLLLNRLF
ncbi:MAG: hypothetical protein HC835_06245 [Oscillatoriales cyanobacterium RM2_1_1]|nr:hypothetical protein [Oscillatoriales cyanobacterium RM2_1_1]